MLSAKQEHYWYHFYNVVGMTRSLTPALEASTLPLGYRGGGTGPVFTMLFRSRIKMRLKLKKYQFLKDITGASEQYFLTIQYCYRSFKQL